MPAKKEPVTKYLYKGRTIFRYKTGVRGVWRYKIQSGISHTEYKTLAAAKKAIDRYSEKYLKR